MFETESLPKNLDSIAPWPELALALAGVERQRLVGHDRVALLKARARQVARDQAQLYADIQSASDAIGEMYRIDDLEEQFNTTCSEVRVALTLSVAAEAEVDLAFNLRERLPEVWSALHWGSVDLRRARVICDQTIHLPREEARQVADTALLTAPDLTTGQLRAGIHRLVMAIDPVSARDRYERRLEERRVVLDSGQDGTANLHGLLPAADANAAMRRINRRARAAKAKGDTRTIDQIRADVLLDLLASRTHNGKDGDRGVVDIKVDLTTLAGLDDNPAQIPAGDRSSPTSPARPPASRTNRSGRSPSPTRTVGLSVSPPPHEGPTTAQRRQVEARNPTCVPWIPDARRPVRSRS